MQVRFPFLSYDYRRTAVRDLVRSGVPQSVAMQQTGHKTPAVFARYNITSTADLEEAVDRLSAYREERIAATETVMGAPDVTVH